MTGRPEGLSPDAARLFDALLAEREDGSPRSEPMEVPLSRAQERLWELGKLAAGSAWGNLPLVFSVRGPLDADALAAAVRDLVTRHVTLRTRYQEADGVVRGRVDGPPEPALVVEPGPSTHAATLERIREIAERPLDPARDPLFSARWFGVAEDEGLLFLLTHHLAADGWALGLLLRELSTCYAARSAGRAPELGGLEGSFARIVESERAAPPPTEAALAYWLNRLDGAPREVPLPAPAPGPAGYRTGRAEGRVGSGPAAALRRVATDHGVTPFAAWLGLLGAVLAAYTEETDIVVGTTVSDRASAEREALVANFGNNLLLRTRFEGEPTFADILARLRETLPRDLAHQDVSIEQLLRRGREGRASPPRLNVLFMLRDGSPDDHFALAGCETGHVSVEAGASTVDLTLDVQDRGEDGFAFAIEYREARISDEDGFVLVRDLIQVAEAVGENPAVRYADLPVERGRWAWEDERSPPGAPAGRSGSEALTASEAVLAELWLEVLDVEEVDPYDNFFELGGHSLVAIDLLERIEERTGVRLTPVDLVSQTLGQLAAVLDDAGAEAQPTEGATSAEPRGWLARLRRSGR